MKLAKIKNEALQSELFVAITSDDKPEINREVEKRWQKILDLAAKIIGVPAGLITKLSQNKLEVFLSSKTTDNIFQAKTALDLGLGWYCETTAGSRNELLIPNAHKTKGWENNPSIPFNMISYLGIPIFWPDGEVFGTFCMLDSKENYYSELYKDLLISLREIIQNDLNWILLLQKAKQDLTEKEIQLREVHHSVKNHFALLVSTINLQTLISNKDQSVDSVLSDLQARITAISMIHDKLYRTLDIEKLYLGNYISELGKHLIDQLSDRLVSFNCYSDEIKVGSKFLVPCGLLINELITNSLKYAFAKTHTPLISLNIKKEDELIKIIYKDNGTGLPDNYDEKNSSTLGITLIKQLVKQLNGEYRFFKEDGFSFEIKFKV